MAPLDDLPVSDVLQRTVAVAKSVQALEEPTKHHGLLLAIGDWGKVSAGHAMRTGNYSDFGETRNTDFMFVPVISGAGDNLGRGRRTR